MEGTNFAWLGHTIKNVAGQKADDDGDAPFISIESNTLENGSE